MLEQEVEKHLYPILMVVQLSQIKLKDLGVTLDPDLSFEEHIKTISRTGFFHLRNIAKIRNFLSKNDAGKINPCFCHF